MSASALLINRSTRSRSSESLRLACTHRRLRNRWSSRGLGTGATRLLARSMRTTSAPRSPRSIAACGPGPMPASSTTRNPCSGPAIAYPFVDDRDIAYLYNQVARPRVPSMTTTDSHTDAYISIDDLSAELADGVLAVTLNRP